MCACLWTLLCYSNGMIPVAPCIFVFCHVQCSIKCYINFLVCVCVCVCFFFRHSDLFWAPPGAVPHCGGPDVCHSPPLLEFWDSGVSSHPFSCVCKLITGGTCGKKLHCWSGAVQDGITAGNKTEVDTTENWKVCNAYKCWSWFNIGIHTCMSSDHLIVHICTSAIRMYFCV